MLKALIPASVFTYVFFPLVLLLAVGFQIRVFEKKRALWGLFGLGLVWGLGNIVQPYNFAWVPDVFIPNFQNTYLLCRAIMVIVFAVVALFSTLRKSLPLKHLSHVLIYALLCDLLWALLAGRYVGP